MDRLKRGPGRPRKHEQRPPTKTARLGTAGKVKQFKASLSDEQRATLAGLAAEIGISEAEQVRRLIVEERRRRDEPIDRP